MNHEAAESIIAPARERCISALLLVDLNGDRSDAITALRAYEEAILRARDEWEAAGVAHAGWQLDFPSLPGTVYVRGAGWVGGGPTSPSAFAARLERADPVLGRSDIAQWVTGIQCRTAKTHDCKVFGE